MAWALSLFLLLLASCSTSRQIAKAKQTLNDNPPAGAEYCATYFPAHDTQTNTSDTVTLRDTVTEQGPVVEVRINDTVTVKAQCPPSRVVHERQVIHDTTRIVRVDRAAVTACESQLAESNDRGLSLSRENDALKARIMGKVLIPWWLIALAGLGLGGWLWYRVKAGALRSVISKMKI